MNHRTFVITDPVPVARVTARACHGDSRPVPRQGTAGWRVTVLLLTVVFLLTALAAPAQGAGPSGHHEAADLPIEGDLSLSRVAEMVLERTPRGVMQAAYARTAQAERTFSKRLFPDPARLSGYHLSDNALDDTGLTEDEVALNLPLWMPGEKRARTALAEVLSEGLESRGRELRWQASGELREALWSVIIARRDAELARAGQARLGEVLAETIKLTRAGDVAKTDQLLVEQELAQWRADTIEREAHLQDAIRMYRALSGARSLPGDYREPLSPVESIEDGHPALRSSRDRLAEARAALDAVSESTNTRPSLQVFWRSSRPEDVLPRTGAIGLGFDFPLGKSATRRPEIARTNENVATAQAEFLTRQRNLELMRHEAEHELHTLELKLANADTMLDAAKERQSIDRVAYDLGEISLREWLRRQSEFKEIERSHELLSLQLGRAIASYNQAVGVIL